jgi:serine phosphatase RsbU (regulator of sigma subunit)
MSERYQDSEYTIAREVQQLLLPKSSPYCDWYCMAVQNRMARDLGGDYFEFLTTPDDCQAIFIGDITGHGLHASMVMAMLYGFVHNTSISGCAPLEMMSRVNAFLRTFAIRSQRIDHLFSTTLFYAIIDPESLVCHYINAGHVRPLVKRGDSFTALQTTAPPLGFFDEPEMELCSFRFEKGDRLLLYTDGITEAINAHGQAYGEDRLIDNLKRFSGTHLEFLDALFDDMESFGITEPFNDDCTAIIFDFSH